MSDFTISAAPLQGYTDHIYRNAHAAAFGGIDEYYTPFIRLEHGKLRNKDKKDVSEKENITLLSQGRIVPQIIAANNEEAESLINHILAEGHHRIDINMGCPFKMLTKRHKGAGLLPYPGEVKALLTSLAQYQGIRFSLKMRLGLTHETECLALADTIAQSAIEVITVHPRTAMQDYSDPVTEQGKEIFCQFAQSLSPQKRITWNGNITTIEQCRHIAGCYPWLNGVMLGRGLLQNPALALEIKENKEMPKTELAERLRLMFNELSSQYSEQMEGGEKQVVDKLTAQWNYLLPSLDKKLRKKIIKSQTVKTCNENIAAALAVLAKS